MTCREDSSDSLARITKAFHELFQRSENTLLIGGAEEPIYLPAGSERTYNEIYYTRDYAASALHEISHWCIAGVERRKQVDYGYWYAPDGRSEAQQLEFERVEAKPQALEWMFSFACNRRFRLSADNAEQGTLPCDHFKLAVYQQVQRFCQEGLNSRSKLLIYKFASAFGVANPICGDNFLASDLR